MVVPMFMDKHNVIAIPDIRKGRAADKADKDDKAANKDRDWAGMRRFMQLVAGKRWTLLLMAIGFLLGRAVILESLAPFALAYFAVVYFVRRDSHKLVALSLVAGSAFAFEPVTLWIALQLVAFYLLVKGLEAYERAELSYAPLLVFATIMLVQLFGTIAADTLSWYAFMMVAVEASLGFVLTLVFAQAMPVLLMAKKTAALKNEEIICLMILLGSIMTGAVGWILYGLSIEHIMSRYVLLLFAFVGGAPLGAAVGVVAGLILSLANIGGVLQMSMLAFAGLLAGLLREGGKIAVAFGLLIGTSILTLYVGGQADVLASTAASAVAVLLFLITPKAVNRTIACYVPGTQEHAKTQHEYARRVRDVTAQRVAQFSEVFRQLARSFSQLNRAPDRTAQSEREEQQRHFMNAVAEGPCQTCHRREMCWDGKFYQTYKMLTEMGEAVEEGRRFKQKEMPREWRNHCVRPEQAIDVLSQQFELAIHSQRWKKQLQESRQLVADQLAGVSQIMEDLSKEIKREAQQLHLQEEQIREAVEGLGLSIHSIDIISLEEGNVEIEITHSFGKGYDECRKIIAPLLSDILGEHVNVKAERYPASNGTPASVIFSSAKEYEIETGIAGVAKGGGLLSGDSFTTVELGNGKYAVAISDGMGNGERAQLESSTALSILQQLLQSGMDEKLAIKSVNSVLLLRSSDEMFATVDLALIDLYTAATTFMKIGSTPSFIKRNGEVIVVSAGNLPIGILQDIEVDSIRVQLQPGDTLFMMTDGIFDAPGHAVNKELWMKRVLQEIKEGEPQEMADALLEQVMRHHEGGAEDDMTVVVARVDKHVPEWATFRWPGISKMERPRTVS